MTKITVLPIEESLDYILEYACSVARFGDGEMDLVAGHGIPYQDYDQELASKLRYIMGLTSSTDFMVCLSDVFEGRERYNHNFSYFWNLHLERFGALYEEICQAPWYGSTFISRPYIDLEDKVPAARYFEKLKQIWAGRDVLIVEGETSRSGVGNDLFAQVASVSRIICPSKNAYAQIDNIAQAIRQHGKGKLVLLMLGPTAKVLSYELSQEGFWTIDLGHVDSEYEWFLMNATYKVKFDHKHTAEHNYDQDITFREDKEYEKQIVANLTQPLISVIVPVYNVERYLDECLQSILRQTYRNLEIILVDDGSTDGSGDKCDQYVREDKRVKVIHKSFSGVSEARNVGLAEARGDYVTFVDSDDVIKEDFLTEMYQQVLTYQADLVISSYYTFNEKDDCFYFFAERATYGECEEISTQEALNRQVSWKQLSVVPFVAVWGKLYHRSLWENISFPVGRLHEDEAVTHKLLLKAKRIVFLNKEYYLYRQRVNSIMTSAYSVQRSADWLLAVKERLFDIVLAGYDAQLLRGNIIENLFKAKQDCEAHGQTQTPFYQQLLQDIALVSQERG